MASRSEKEKQRQVQDKCQIILGQLLREEDNKYCVDCDAKGPRWASWNLGIFLCIRCAGIHRNLGVHISKVKSVNLDTWTPEQVGCLQQMGNSKARAVYEANLPDNFRRPQTDSSLEAFVRAKYEQKKYIAKEWVPPTSSKPAFDIEEEHRKEKEKKRGTRSKGGVPHVEMPPLQQPAALPRPHAAASSSGGGKSPSSSSKSGHHHQTSSVQSSPLNNAENGKPPPNAASFDLLGLDAPSIVSNSSLNDDPFEAFISAAPLAVNPSTTSTPPSSLATNGHSNSSASSLSDLELAKKSSMLSKESILSLYTTNSTTTTIANGIGARLAAGGQGGPGALPLGVIPQQQQQNNAFGVPGGMYIQAALPGQVYGVSPSTGHQHHQNVIAMQQQQQLGGGGGGWPNNAPSLPSAVDGGVPGAARGGGFQMPPSALAQTSLSTVDFNPFLTMGGQQHPPPQQLQQQQRDLGPISPSTAQDSGNPLSVTRMDLPQQQQYVFSQQQSHFYSSPLQQVHHQMSGLHLGGQLQQQHPQLGVSPQQPQQMVQWGVPMAPYVPNPHLQPQLGGGGGLVGGPMPAGGSPAPALGALGGTPSLSFGASNFQPSSTNPWGAGGAVVGSMGGSATVGQSGGATTMVRPPPLQGHTLSTNLWQ